MSKVRVWTAVAAVAAGLGLVYAGIGTAGGGKGANADVEKIAAALKKGDTASAKTMAAAVAKKYELEDVMSAFKVKKKSGLAWPGAKDNEGIELKIRGLARDQTKDFKHLEDIAYTTLAVGLIAEAKTPEKDSGKKLKKNWTQYVHDMQEGAQALAKAAGDKSAAEVKTAATKVNNSCNACHSDFRL